MPIKHVDFMIKGMHRDLSENAFNPEFAYENQNLRIVTDKNSSSEHTGDLMALTNERGNKFTSVNGIDNNIIGIPIGQCLINNQWVIFTVDKSNDSSSKSRIYKLWLEDEIMYGELLYEGNLGFDYNHPIEAIPYYENEQIQKVYWTDGINQPRFINVVEKPEKRAKWTDTSFDFVATINMLDTQVFVYKNSTGGRFPAGVIQWFFTYSRQFGQETNIFASTNLFELKHSDRGAAPDEITTQSFRIRAEYVDTNFDFVNVYSVIRTSLDSVPIASLVGSVPISTYFPAPDVEVPYIEIVDTNLNNTAIDPQELFYKGGESITAYTMEQKDNTLFLGNYTLTRSYIKQNLRDELKNYAQNNFTFAEAYRNKPHFRDGNKYRFGVQFQHNTGKWSEVVWIGDYKCDVPFNPETTVVGRLELDSTLNNLKSLLIKEGYVKARPVVVYPNIAERGILAQGILAPTISMSQNKSKLYPDYFFRFFSNSNWGDNQNDMDSSYRYWYNKLCWISTYRNGDEYRNEYQVGKEGGSSAWVENEITDNYPQVSDDYYSFYSPDIEFSDSYQTYNLDSVNVIHNANITGFTSDAQHEVLTSSISKPTVGHRQWVDESIRKPKFYDMWNYYGASISDVEYKLIEGSSKEGEEESSETTSVLVSRWTTYGMNRSYQGGYMDFVKATEDSVDYFWFNAKYPNRIPSYFKPKQINNTHYVGGFLWEDTFMNVTTEHSELLNQDLPSRSSSFMQYYGQFIFPVMLWQASGSICYDVNEKAASVLKSNKIINYLTATRRTVNSQRIATNTFCKVANGINVVKLQNDEEYGAILYSNRVDDCIIWRDCYASIFYLSNDNNYKFNWDIPVTNRYIYQDRIDPNAGTYYYNNGRIEDFTRTLPYDDTIEGISEFKWHNLGRDANRNCTADIRYTSTPNYVIKIDRSDFRNMCTSQKTIPIVSIQQRIPDNIFGGNTEAAIQKNNFYVAGSSVTITTSNGTPKDIVRLIWDEGDTYYQEYECLKTYPSSFENENCITEILKVPVETYYNLNGRYDTWKDNPTFATSPANWNLMNPVYNQKNNFFVYHGLDLSTNSVNSFPNSFTWTLVKWAGETVDKWTQITTVSTMDVDGSKGEITKLIKLQDNLLCFQPRGISQILYNEREQIATGSGTPIELANSGKVSGTRYITEQVGCNNKWSICKTESGLYWVDDENKAIMAWNQQLANLSDSLGFHSWIKDKSTLDRWNPVDFKSFVTYYDPYFESVMFFYDDNMLSYNTQLNCFDSFFSYGHVPYYMAFNSTAFTLSDKDSDGRDNYKVWEQHKGDYNYFYVNDNCTYDEADYVIAKGRYDRNGLPTNYGYEPYYITLLVNPDMPYDKIFTNLDMRTDMWNKSKELLEETFSHIHVWSEFQENKSTLIRNVDIPKVHLPAQHSILKKKFRVWYIDIPRDIKNPDKRYYKRDRMRNTWMYLKLSKELINNDEVITYPYMSDNKHIIHHIGVSYFI